MTIEILIDSIDRKDWIDYSAFIKSDILTSQIDTLQFDINILESDTWKPEVGQEIEVTIDTVKEFAGYILEVQKSVRGKDFITYRVICEDYTGEMDRQRVVKAYSKQTVNDIIADINTDYLSGFTLNNVNCPITIDYIAFNYEQPSKCLQMLADAVNYEWYVDYNKDIHFFSKFSKNAPFGLSDDSGNYIYNSLIIKEDTSQLKNVVYVRGGEYEADERTETYVSDGQQTTVNLSYKYSSKPTVSIDGATQSVGVDGLDDFTSHDVLWNFNGKYLFLEEVATSGIHFDMTGTPLFPVLALVYDENSVQKYGEFVDRIIDKSIGSKKAARERARAELDAHAEPITQGEFETVKTGLRSGQLIHIQSDVRDIDEHFLINKVTTRMISPNKMIWKAYFCSVRPLGIIDFLQQLILADNKKIVIDRNEILELVRSVYEGLLLEEEITKEAAIDVDEPIRVAELMRKDPFTPSWVLAHYFPVNDDDSKRMGRLNISMYLY